jgi:hypothetical protein
MPVLTFKSDVLKPENEQPNIAWDLPDWIDSNEAIIRAECDPEICLAGVLQDENWRGYPQYAVVVQYFAAPAYYGYRIAVSEQTIYEVSRKNDQGCEIDIRLTVRPTLCGSGIDSRKTSSTHSAAV